MSIAERWQAVGLNSAGLSNRRIAVNFGVNTVEDRPRSGRPRKTTPREDSYLKCQARLQPFSKAVQLRGMCTIGGRISVRTAGYIVFVCVLVDH